jgi:hypothetical protein
MALPRSFTKGDRSVASPWADQAALARNSRRQICVGAPPRLRSIACALKFALRSPQLRNEGKTRKVISRVAAALRIAAQSVRNSDHKLGEYCRRMKARLGKAEGITATAHKLARILYAVITRRVPYNEEEAFKQTPATQTRRIHNLQKQAAKLGLLLIPAT